MSALKPKSFHLQWSITERCNLNCKHCYKDQKLIDEELSIAKELEILDKFISQVDKWRLLKESTRISFTGGEPLVKDGFLKLLKKCKENHHKFSYGILSNSLLMNVPYVEKLKELEVDYIQISLEGMKQKNDYIRGDGMFDKIIKSAKIVQNNEIPINFSMTVSEINLDDVPKLIKLGKEMNVPIAIRRLVPIGNAENIKDLLLSPERVRQLWQYIFEVNQRAWSGVGIGCEDGIASQDFVNYNPASCSAGYASFTVMPNGDVYPCRRLPIYSGNLITQSFQEIYDSKQMKALRDMNNVNDVCYKCPHFDKCQGGAKCISSAYFNDFRAPDPQCWRLFDQLPKNSLKWRKTNREDKISPRWCEGF